METVEQPSNERHAIAEGHDFLLIVAATEERGGNIHHVKKLHEFEVSKKVLGQQQYFQRVFTPGFADTGKPSYLVKGDDPFGWKVWLQVLHGCTDQNTFRVTIDTVWHVLLIAHQYQFDPLCREIKAWFTKWYKQHGPFDIDQHAMLLYPCYAFDDAQAFKETTKALVYNVPGHITEQKPYCIQETTFRLDQRIIGTLNSARGRLRTILHSGLYDPIRELLKEAICPEKKNVLWAYLTALERTIAWPLEIHGPKQGIMTLLSLIEGLRYIDPHPNKDTCTDNSCGMDFRQVAKNAAARTKRYFDGLCLDCMNHSKSGDDDKDYWHHADRLDNYDEDCRIQHGEPTWYFSFMGRKAKMDLFQRNRRRRA